MVDYHWPEAAKRSVLGTRVSRLDGPAKVTGAAKYTYDIHPPGLLYGWILRCPHAHARITKLDLAPAQGVPGVKAALAIQQVGAEIQWALDEIAIVVATSEAAAQDGARAALVDYEVLPHFVDDTRPDLAPGAQPGQAKTTGDPDAALGSAAVTITGEYGLPSIAHCCLEPHGSVSQWQDEQNLTLWLSTQGVSVAAPDVAEHLKVPASNVHVLCEHMGGGFGSKFGADRWDLYAATLARRLGAPVKLLLDRESELAVAGDRPSAYARVRVGAAADGTLSAWSSESWGSGGLGGSGSPPLPYVFQVPDSRHAHTSVPTNTPGSRAWRAPNHPQACLITMAALEDLAAALKMDPLDFFLKNIGLTGQLAPTYAEQLRTGAELIGWKQHWHPRGQGAADGTRGRGVGVSFSTWGGRAHRSSCEITVHPDGAVEAKLGSQDLGTGTRTAIAIVLAETFSLPLSAVQVRIGDNRYPASGPSGGSTTIGGVTGSTRRAAQDALFELFGRVAPELGATPEQLVAEAGRIHVAGDPARGLSWKEACARLGLSPLSVTGQNPGPGNLNSSGVGGIQMADVSVDVETGVVKVNRMAAVQDCGLIVDLKTAESQVHGGLIMGIGYALSEEKIYDPTTGRLLNGSFDFYRLAGLMDVGELVVHMMTGPGHDERGVIGLGEPPVISPGAAISNAVANAIGVRVPHLPLTPDRVLAALEKGGQG
jgi:xanthine dehydrogenase YagR molybdenum-binding subunit